MFKVEINTGNASFRGPYGEESELFEANEVVRLLKQVIKGLHWDKREGTLIDYNGNKVGRWYLE